MATSRNIESLMRPQPLPALDPRMASLADAVLAGISERSRRRARRRFGIAMQFAALTVSFGIGIWRGEMGARNLLYQRLADITAAVSLDHKPR